MKFNYLFVNQNNGHGKTYHPFKSDTVLNQERITKWLNEIPGSGRMGTSLNDLLYRLGKEHIPFEEYRCIGCDSMIHILTLEKAKSLELIFGIQWILIEGVGGNY
jgi:hypothetical protein